MTALLTLFRNGKILALGIGLVLCFGLYLRFEYMQSRLAEQENDLALLRAVNISQKKRIDTYLKELQENERRISVLFKEKEERAKNYGTKRSFLYQNTEDWSKQKIPQDVLKLFQY